MSKEIKILTHLHEGIYQNCGGGQTCMHYEWNLGPRNLIKAVKKLYEHRREMDRCYGSIGGGGSWLEVCGLEIVDYDLDDIMSTEAARSLLVEIADGTYSETRRQMNSDAMRDREEFARDRDDDCDIWCE